MTLPIAETVKEATKMQPWGFWYRNAPVMKSGKTFTVFGKPVETVGEAKKKIDNAYTSLSKSIR
jgi:hypothetical protein